MVWRGEGRRHEAGLFHPFASVLLEPRQRAFPPRRAALNCRRAGTSCSRWNPSGPGASRTCYATHGEAASTRFAPLIRHCMWPGTRPRMTVAAALEGADAVIVHEWNDPALVAAIGAARRRRRRFHPAFPRHAPPRRHRPEQRCAPMISALRRRAGLRRASCATYRTRGGRERIWTWHEAADTRLFRPPAGKEQRGDLVWIGNWGDGERSAELDSSCSSRSHDAAACRSTSMACAIPRMRCVRLARRGHALRRLAAECEVPAVFARHRPPCMCRGAPTWSALPGIPTIRVFEALACGIPLVSAPWHDAEGLFRPATTLGRARRGGDEALFGALRTTRRCAPRWQRTACHHLARHTCAIGSTSCSASSGELATVAHPQRLEEVSA